MKSIISWKMNKGLQGRKTELMIARTENKGLLAGGKNIEKKQLTKAKRHKDKNEYMD